MKMLPDRVKEKIRKLKQFDQISLIWSDASVCANVFIPEDGVKIVNHAVETTVRSEGKFLWIQEGNTFNEPHILLVKDMTDERKATLQSIPLVLVKDVQVFNKVPLLAQKSLGLMSGKSLEIRYRDGIVKRIFLQR